MGVIGDDEIRPLSYAKDPNTLQGYTWKLKDVDSPDPEFVGISLHLTEEQRVAFHTEHFAASDRKYGKRVPGSFTYAAEVLDVIASAEFRRFVEESTGDQIKGLLVLKCTMMYLQRFNLIRPSVKIDDLV